MIKALVLSIFLVILNISFSQENIFTATILDKTQNEAVIGVKVYFPEIKLGAISDLDGKVSISGITNGVHSVQISMLGFKEIDTSLSFPLVHNNIIFYLEEVKQEIEGVVVSVARSSRTIENLPTRIEYIGGEELDEKAIMNSANISMVLRESTGIQMQQTSINSGNSSIRIQGMDGRYTQLLKDGFPLFGGFAGGLSVMQIPPLDLKQFGIIKGSSSTLYGGGAIAGLVNMVSKTPDYDPTLDIMLTQTHALGSTANIFYSKRKKKVGYTLYASCLLYTSPSPRDRG